MRSRRSTAAGLVGIALLAVAAPQRAAPAASPRFTRVYALAPREGVFAYARISPSGKTLVYASELKKGSDTTETVTVVDLASRKIKFSEPGIDAYWSNDGTRMIYLSKLDPSRLGVSMRHQDTGVITRDVAPAALGDYFSWAERDGKNVILTIQSNYYPLDGDRGILPARRVNACPGIGVGDRPLVSKDGTRITTFVGGAVVVRGIDNCDGILNTGIQGGKADFSWDGRYVAFHAAKTSGAGYEIVVVDTKDRTVRTVTNLPGSSLFPSWTKDGRLCFRYDGDDYRGFMIADDVLSAPARPLPAGGRLVPAAPEWAALFPETPAPAHRANLVLIWSSWSAHGPMALAAMQQARDYFRAHAIDAGTTTAIELSSQAEDIDRIRRAHGITLPQIPLAPNRLALTEALNQIPTTLLFIDGVQVDRRLGAQSFDALRDWTTRALASAGR